MKFIIATTLLQLTVYAAKGKKKHSIMMSVPLSIRNSPPSTRIIEKLPFDAPFEYLDFRATCIRSYDHIGEQCECKVTLNTPRLNNDDLIIVAVGTEKTLESFIKAEPHLDVPRYQCQVVHDAKVPTYNADGHCQIYVRPTVLRSLAEGKKLEGIPCETYLTRHPDYELEKTRMTKGINIDKKGVAVWIPLFRTSGPYTYNPASSTAKEADGGLQRGFSLTFAGETNPLYIAGCEVHQDLGGSFCSCRISNVDITPDSWVICPPSYGPTNHELGPISSDSCGIYYSPKYVNLKTSNPEEYSRLAHGTACHTFVLPPRVDGVDMPVGPVHVNPDHEFTSVPYGITKEITFTSKHTHLLTIDCLKETHGCSCTIKGPKGAFLSTSYHKGMMCPSAKPVKDRPNSDQCVVWINPKILDLMVARIFQSTVQVNPHADLFGSGAICYTSVQEPPTDKLPIELKPASVEKKEEAVSLEKITSSESIDKESPKDELKVAETISSSESIGKGSIKGDSGREDSVDRTDSYSSETLGVPGSSDTKGLTTETKRAVLPSRRKKNKKSGIFKSK